MTEKTIMYESDEAAHFRDNISGWVSGRGRFCGDNEDLARYDGSTHRKCECGNVIERLWTKCPDCRKKAADEKYQAMPYQKWDNEPLVLRDLETYFFSDSELYGHMSENELKTLDLIICEPNTAPVIDYYAEDVLPEDLYIDDVAPELANKIADLNQYILDNKPILSWSGGKYRTTVTLPEGYR